MFCSCGSEDSCVMPLMLHNMPSCLCHSALWIYLLGKIRLPFLCIKTSCPVELFIGQLSVSSGDFSSLIFWHLSCFLWQFRGLYGSEKFWSCYARMWGMSMTCFCNAVGVGHEPYFKMLIMWMRDLKFVNCFILPKFGHRILPFTNYFILCMSGHRILPSSRDIPLGFDSSGDELWYGGTESNKSRRGGKGDRVTSISSSAPNDISPSQRKTTHW